MSVMLENLVRLGDVCGERRWLEIAEAVMRAYHQQALANPFGYSNLLSAIDLYQERPAEIVLAGEDTDTDALARALAEVYLPNRVIVRAHNAPSLIASLVEGKHAVDGQAAAWVCRDFQCERPEADPVLLARALRN